MKRRLAEIRRLGKRKGMWSAKGGWTGPTPLQRMDYRQSRRIVHWNNQQATGVDISDARQHIDSVED